ncbi:MAG TPA: hypothetical protein VEQ85_02775 [Lacipirellulaceae bacterium]|nr:hypothetical protein [Lacipirellulaceae bacterium]
MSKARETLHSDQVRTQDYAPHGQRIPTGILLRDTVRDESH